MSRASESRVATAYARAREHLAYLGLPTASERLAAELERAEDEASAPVEVLERLLAAEVEANAARRLAGRLRFALYPLTKRLSDFELDFQPSIDRAVIAELSTLRSWRSGATCSCWARREWARRIVRLMARSTAGPGSPDWSRQRRG